MHEAGWAHLDLKPGNVLRRPRLHAWTLIDFGCSAKIGAKQNCVCPAHVCCNRKLGMALLQRAHVTLSTELRSLHCCVCALMEDPANVLQAPGAL